MALLGSGVWTPDAVPSCPGAIPRPGVKRNLGALPSACRRGCRASPGTTFRVSLGERCSAGLARVPRVPRVEIPACIATGRTPANLSTTLETSHPDRLDGRSQWRIGRRSGGWMRKVFRSGRSHVIWVSAGRRSSGVGLGPATEAWAAGGAEFVHDLQAGRSTVAEGHSGHAGGVITERFGWRGSITWFRDHARRLRPQHLPVDSADQ
jgi:hypothetical protein